MSVSTPLHFASVLVTPPAPVTNAFLTLETMVNYNCQLFPPAPSSQVLFTGVTLRYGGGGAVAVAWQAVVKHDECGQGVAIYEEGREVALKYNSSVEGGGGR